MAKNTGPRHVRLKPYDPKRGNLMRTYVHGPSGKVFEEKKGWYVVDAKLADYLKDVRQIESDDLSQPAFDICTKAEAAAIDARERKAKVRAGAEDANDLTTEDLHRREPAAPRRERAPRAPRVTS